MVRSWSVVSTHSPGTRDCPPRGGREKAGAPKASAASCRITPVTSDSGRNGTESDAQPSSVITASRTSRKTSKTREERQRLMNEMGAYRQKHRQDDVARGKRVPGGRIQMHAIMWPRWIEVAVNHEMAAREIYAELVEAGRIGSGRNSTSRLSRSPPPPARSKPCTQMLCT